MLSAAQIDALANGLAGALGASIGCFCVAPLGLVVQMKTTGGKGGSSEEGLSADKLSVASILQGRIRSDGFLGLWRGEWMNAVAPPCPSADGTAEHGHVGFRWCATVEPHAAPLLRYTKKRGRCKQSTSLDRSQVVIFTHYKTHALLRFWDRASNTVPYPPGRKV